MKADTPVVAVARPEVRSMNSVHDDRKIVYGTVSCRRSMVRSSMSTSSKPPATA